jgi:hypothetical protein
MAKFNTRRTRTQTHSPVRSTGRAGVTYEGATGYGRDPKSQLLLLSASNFMNADAFYELMADRDNRLLGLVRQVAVEDPVWTLELVRWLRDKQNLRTVSLVLGLEAAKAVNDLSDEQFLALDRKFRTAKFNKAHVTGGAGLHPKYGQGVTRLLAKAGIRRGDEPGEAMAYWFRHYGRKMPMPMKRGIGDTVVDLYTQRSLLKYDTASHGFRFADVIMLTHPKAPLPGQNPLFKFALDRRYHPTPDIPDNLGVIKANAELRKQALTDPRMLLDPNRLKWAGMTWEDALSLAGDRVSKRELWEAMIPSMGYMALLRNLRNFDQAGVSDGIAQQVIDRLVDPSGVAWSRQLPFRFLTAHMNVPSLRWSYPLEQALNLSLANVPSLPGRTLILVDTSTSMFGRFTDRGGVHQMQQAALFGVALASRAEDATVVSFSNRTVEFPLIVGESVLNTWTRFDRGYKMGGGTYTARALRTHYQGHDRVVIITDEQASMDSQAGEVARCVPAHVPMHTINLVGYAKGMAPSGADNRHVYGGVSDAMFKLIPLVERGVNADWPWLDATPMEG